MPRRQLDHLDHAAEVVDAVPAASDVALQFFAAAPGHAAIQNIEEGLGARGTLFRRIGRRRGLVRRRSPPAGCAARRPLCRGAGPPRGRGSSPRSRPPSAAWERSGAECNPWFRTRRPASRSWSEDRARRRRSPNRCGCPAASPRAGRGPAGATRPRTIVRAPVRESGTGSTGGRGGPPAQVPGGPDRRARSAPAVSGSTGT